VTGSGPEEFRRLLADYAYDLPVEAIAQRPAEPRDAARLLILPRGGGPIGHARVRDLPRHLRPGDLLVLNDTRVLRARLLGRKVSGGGEAELLFVRKRGAHRWEALARMAGRMRPGCEIALPEGWRARLIAPLEESSWEVEVLGPGVENGSRDRSTDEASGNQPREDEDFLDLLERVGHVPLPPYIRRPEVAADASWYQTVHARQPGAVAAPTAGLHFSAALFRELAAAGIERAFVTLHVGPGTFRPLSATDWERGELHAETFALPADAARAVERTRERGGRVIAVGTTSARVLETRALPGGRVEPGAGETTLFLRPPRVPVVVDGLVTNFHLPRTSLLMLVAVFAGRARVLEAYRRALAEGYRFYSYGDAMLVL